jgi:hypothetical protein
MVADRVALGTKGKVQCPFSRTQIMECSKYVDGVQPTGCDGNGVVEAAASLVSAAVPLVPESDYPRQYDANPTDVANAGFMPNPTDFYVTLSSSASLLEPIGAVGDAAHKRNIENLKQCLYNEGPLCLCFDCYEEFNNYDGLTIYEPSDDAKAAGGTGGHAVRLVGWGTDPASGVQYWICSNSWGRAWPPNHKKCAGVGFFYVRMGQDVMHIESFCAVSAMPKIFNADRAPSEKQTDAFPGEEMACKGRGVVDSTKTAGAGFLAGVGGRVMVAGLLFACLFLVIKNSKPK